MNQSVKYRQNAAVCYEAVRICTDPRQKAHLLAMARSWISLADQAERIAVSVLVAYFDIAALQNQWLITV